MALKRRKDAGAAPPHSGAPSHAVPLNGTMWPLFLVSAAVAIGGPQGGIGIRVIQSYRLGPDPDSIREWFLQELKANLPSFQVIDLMVGTLDRDVLQMALGVADFQQEVPQ